MIVLIREAAYEDIRHIRAWISRDKPAAAENVINRIFESIERLGEIPGLGHHGRATGTFEWVVVGLPYIIVYTVDHALDELQVVAVFHGKQDR